MCMAVGKVSLLLWALLTSSLGCSGFLLPGSGRRSSGAVADDLVDVHVRLGARAGLPDRKRKVAVQFAAQDGVASGGNGGCLVGGMSPKRPLAKAAAS